MRRKLSNVIIVSEPIYTAPTLRKCGFYKKWIWQQFAGRYNYTTRSYRVARTLLFSTRVPRTNEGPEPVTVHWFSYSHRAGRPAGCCGRIRPRIFSRTPARVPTRAYNVLPAAKREIFTAAWKYLSRPGDMKCANARACCFQTPRGGGRSSMRRSRIATQETEKVQ